MPDSFQKLSQKKLEFELKISDSTFENLPENTKICAVYETGQSDGFFLAEGRYYNPILLSKSQTIESLIFSFTVEIPGFSNFSKIKFAMFCFKENKNVYLKDSISTQSFSV